MATINENLQFIKNSAIDIKQAIINKGGVIDGNIGSWASAINNIPSGGGGGSSSGKGDVTFYDYDGTILHSFSKDEFLALNELPSLPIQPGLTCQGWNYDITNAKTYVEEYGKLDIGATYITDDGKTRLYIKIAADGRMTVPLYFSQTKANGVTIDWGDGSATQTLSGTGNKNTSHTYTSIGDYCITLTVASGCTLGLGNNSSSYCVMGSTGNNGKVYCNMLQKVEIGAGITSIGNYAFHYCYSLSSIVIPNSVTSIVNYAFRDCYSLSSVTIPKSVTSIGDHAFYKCYSLSSIVIPNSVTRIGSNEFYNCYSLSSIVIPNSVTRIGDKAFYNCYSLSSIVIPNSVTSIVNYAFYYCYSLSSVVIPNSVTSIGDSAFQNCCSLSSVVIPNSVTSIGSYAFCFCYSLSSVMIPKSVTSIGSYAFQNCYGVAFFDFSNHTSVPTLSSTNAFSSIPSDCKIIVPDNLYNTWIAATNWSTYASYIVKASEFPIND
jgi:hypothetical protein